MNDKNERIQILEMIENGTITASEGASLLKALEADDVVEDIHVTGKDEPESVVSEGDPFPQKNESTAEPLSGDLIADTFDPEIEKWRRWWMIPLWIGVGITVIGGLLMAWAYQATGFSFWFGCSWLPFLLGIAVMAMAWSSRTARWLHLRVQQEPGEWPRTIAFSFPLPLRFAAWVMRIFGQFIPKVNETGVDFDQLIQVLENSTNSDTPFYVEVDEGENGEKVQIYIG
jgi:hypothetical protein